jgi:hypothetical protein
MTFSFRKRTKGKSSWLNFSASKGRGFGVSGSTKLAKNVTANYGRDGLRTTFNLGNGVRYTWKPSKNKSADTSKVSEFFDVGNDYSSYEEIETKGPHWVIKLILSFIIIIAFMAGMLFLSMYIRST